MGYWDTHPIVEGEPTIVPFTPDFRDVKGYYVDNNGNVTVMFPLNVDYFATMPTAHYIANKYGDGVVYELPWEGVGGPIRATGNIYCTKIKSSGRLINCGILAAYFKRNPENLFPGVANKLITDIIASGN